MNELVDIHSEAVVLASLVMNSDLYFEFETLSPRHFSEISNQCLYYALSEIAKRENKVVDKVNILTILKSNKALDKASSSITEETIDDLLKYSPEVARSNVEDYRIAANNIMDKSFRRDMLLNLKKVESTCYSSPEKDIKDSVYSMLDSIIQTHSVGEKSVTMDKKIRKLLETLYTNQESGAFIPFPIPELNDFFRIEKTQTHVFSALPKVGKSLWMMNLLVYLANQGVKCLYIDTEIDDLEFVVRLISHLSQVTYRKVLDGDLTEEEADSVERAVKWIEEHPFTHKYIPVVTDAEIYATVIKERNTYGCDALILDYLKGNGEHALDAYKNSTSLGLTLDMIKNRIAGAFKMYSLVCVQSASEHAVAKSKDILRVCSSLTFIVEKNKEEIIKQGGLEYGNIKFNVHYCRSGMKHDPTEYISVLRDGNVCTFKACLQPKINEPY